MTERSSTFTFPPIRIRQQDSRARYTPRLKAFQVTSGILTVALLVIAARSRDPVRPYTGFSERTAVSEQLIEQRLLTTADAARAGLMTRDLAAQPHVAG